MEALSRRDGAAIVVAVVSDTHLPHFARRWPVALEHIAALQPDVIVHCGDFTTLAVVAPLERLAPVEGVAGNNDGPELIARFGRRKLLEYGGCRIGVVHGDGGARGSTLERARAAFAADDVRAIFFGHSHVPYCALHDGVWVVNPGSPTDKRRQPRYSIAAVTLGAGRLEPRLIFFGP